MAVTKRPGRFWSFLHFLIRFLGLTGLLVGCAGLVLAHLDGLLVSWSELGQTLKEALQGTTKHLAAYLLLGGGAAVLLALVVEALRSLLQTAASHSLLGINAVVQGMLAVALLVGLNVWSAGLRFHLLDGRWNADLPGHYQVFDLTRGRLFTLSEPVRSKLKKLREETNVVILQRHRTSASFGEHPDQYDAAAERKVVEKVKDRVDLLREVGPQFQVEVLDTQSRDYFNRLEELGRKSPELKAAIASAPENSIFFASGPHVQQLSFNDFLRLDKTASREDNDGRGNLVLNRPRDVDPTLNRIVNVEQRKPRVGVLVVHEALTSEGSLDFYTTAGVRKTLETNGFEVREVILKRERPGSGSLDEPAVDLLEDSKLDRLLDEQKQISLDLEDLNERIKREEELVQLLPKAPLATINQKLAAFGLLMPTERGREPALKRFQEELALDQQERQNRQELLHEITQEIKQLDADQIGERRRMTDLRAKLDRWLSECDLVLVPRVTTNPEGVPIAPAQVHGLDAQLVAALKDYLRSGKPILVSFGSVNRPTGSPEPPDELEKALRELGLQLGRKTVLFDAEKRTFTGDEPNVLRVRPLRLPALELKGSAEHALERVPTEMQRGTLTRRDLAVVGNWLSAPVGGPLPALAAVTPGPRPVPHRESVNKIRQSLDFASRCLGEPLNLTLRKPRPVAVDPAVASDSELNNFETTILVTSPAAWNDENPFPSSARPIPRFERPTGFDPDAGTIDEKRQGAFPVAVSFVSRVPKDWLTSASQNQEKVRIVAIGSGNVFTGRQLAPAQELLLLDCCNWALGREDRLAKPGEVWKYPRVELTAKEQSLWLWACRLGLPVLFAYLGAVVLLFRRLR